MTTTQLLLLRYFHKNEKDFSGNLVDWNDYHGQTMQELDRLRHEIGSPCYVIRGGSQHGYLKETAIDAVFPGAPFASVVMALFQSGLSKGVYQGGSIHLDMRMGPLGLARAWMAFKPELFDTIFDRGFGDLKNYSADGWDYYAWGHNDSWKLLQYLVDINDPVI